MIKLCEDYDEDCQSIFIEGRCVNCWLYDPAKGLCPYLRNTGVEERQFVKDVELID